MVLIALRQGIKGIKQRIFFFFCFLKEKSGRESGIVLKRQYQIFLTLAIILMQTRNCSIFYAVRKPIFAPIMFSVKEGFFILIKRKTERENLNRWVEVTKQHSFPGNGKRNRASAKWIFFLLFVY